jgi:TetR/AcrR family transcriptional regulator, regulator of cefoperazone and chloramphenicol sensitivity
MSDLAPHSLDWTSDLLHPQDDQGKRRTALLQAAFDAIAETGFEGLRTRSVAKRAGVNIATLHYYFPSKQELIEGLAHFIGAKFITIHGPAPPPSEFSTLDRLRQEFSDGRFYLQQHPEMLLVMQEFVLRGKRDPEVQKVVEQMNFHWRSGIEDMVLRGVADGVFRVDIEPTVLVGMLMAIFSGTAAVSSDLIDSIQQLTESWILSDKVKKQLETNIGAKA